MTSTAKKLVALVAASVVVIATLTMSVASALSPGVHFSSTNLSTWQTNGIVWSLGQSGGKVVAGGTFSQLKPPNGSTAAPVDVNGLAILDAESGAPDSCQLPAAFGGSTPTVRAIATSEDGKTVYVGGNFGSIGGVSTGRVAAIDVASCKVTSWRAPQVSSTVRSIAVKGNTVYIGGDFESVGGTQRLRVAALDRTTGALLPFVADADATVKGIGVSPDGTKVAIGGNFFNVNGAYSHSIAMVDATTGNNIRTYPPGFISDRSTTQHIFSGSDGRFYISNEGTGGGVFDGRAALDWSTGDEVWRDRCLGATQATYEYRGTLYSASHAHDCSDKGFQDGKRNFWMAQDAATSDLYGWDPRTNSGIGEGIGPRALTVAKGRTTGKDYLWSGGEFTIVNGQPQQALTRFGPDDTVKPPIPVPAAQATSEGSIQVRWRTVVDPDNSEITYTVTRNGTPVWSGQGSSVWWKRPQMTFVDTDVRPGTSYSYRVTASDGTNTSNASASASATASAPSASYAATVRADKPSLYWDSTSTGTWVHDVGATSSGERRLSGQATQGPVTSTEGAVRGDLSGSYTFDGADDYVWNDEYAQGPKVYSVETWIKTTTTRGGKIVGYGSGRPRTDNGNTQLSGSYDRHLYMLNDGRVNFGVYNGNTITLTTPQALNDGTWHQLVATQGPNGMALYVDGRRVATNGVTDQQAFNGTWRIGGDNISGWPDQPASYFFAGQIDETSVYPGVLDRRRVSAHYESAGGTVTVTPRPTDALGAAVYDDDPQLFWRLDETSGTTANDSSYFGTVPGQYSPDTVLGGQGVHGTSARTSTDRATIASASRMSTSRPYSAETWFRTTTRSGGKIFGFESSQTGNGGNYDKMLWMSNDGRLNYGTWTGYTNIVRSDRSYNDGRWHQVAVTQDGSGIKLYVDGALIGTNPQSGAENGDGYWRLGGGNLGGWPDSPSSFYFDGSVDEFAVFSAALPADRIAAHFGSGVNDTEAPTAPAGLSATSQDGTVRLTWAPSTDNVQVQGYRVYRDVVAGFTPSEATLQGESSSTSFSQDDPTPGTYFYKVVAVDGVDNASAASNAAAVTVADRTAPTVPSDVVATAQGRGTVSVTWTESTDNVGVTGYDVHRGTSSDFVPSAANRVGESQTGAFGDSGLGRGTYYYKVVARDAAGNLSAPSAVAAAEVGDSTAPTAPTSLAATVSGADVSLSWTASTDDVAVAGYAVHRGRTADFVPDADNRIGTSASTSFTDAGRPTGTYYYRVTALDAAGNTSTPSDVASAVVKDEAAPSTPADLTATVAGADVTLSWSASSDDFGVDGYEVHRGTSAGFTPAQATKVGDVNARSFTDQALAPGTYYYKVVARDGAGNLSAPTAAASATVQRVATGDPVVVDLAPTEDASTISSAAGTNYGANNQLTSRGGTSPMEAFLKFSLPPAPSGTTLTGVKLSVRTSTDGTATTADSTEIRRVPGTGWTESTITWANRPTGTGDLIGTLAPAPALNTRYAVTGDPGALAGSLGQAVTLRMSGLGSDNLRVWSKDSATANQPVLTLTFSPRTTPADTTAPTAPQSLTTSTSGSDVALQWQASTDDTAVTGYTVHRSTTAGFTPTAGTKVADVTGTTFQDRGLADGTYHYVVVARDGADNTSSPSASASATVRTAAVAPVTVTLEPVEDAMTISSAPSTNYGANNQLAVRGGSSPQESFLRFRLPQAPAGTVLTSARLSVRTSTDATATSTDQSEVRLLTDAQWTESAITWATRPLGTGQLLALLDPAPATNTRYERDGDASVLRGSLGSDVTLRVSGTGSDNLRLWSKDSTAANRPTLTLTFAAP